MLNLRGPEIPSDQIVLFGKPSVAPPDNIVRGAIEVIPLAPTCLEAHLPQYFALGAMPKPRLALVLVIDDEVDKQTFTKAADALARVSLGSSVELDLWVLNSNDPLTAGVRKAMCRL